MVIGNRKFDSAVASQPCLNEKVSGDVACIKILPQGSVILAVIDVAGHGDNAYSLAKKILSFLDQSATSDLSQLVNNLHNEIRGSRGCAGAFCLIDLEKQTINYIGVGNVQASLFGKDKKHFLNRAGIIGYALPKLREEKYDFTSNNYLILYSDGIKEHFNLEKIRPEIQLSEVKAQELAEAILDNFGKINDDSICLTFKIKDD